MPDININHLSSNTSSFLTTEGNAGRIIAIEIAKKNLEVIQGLKQDQKLITDLALGILTADTPKSEEYCVVVWFGIRAIKRRINGFKKDGGVTVVYGSFKAVEALLAAGDKEIIDLFQGALTGLNRLVATYIGEEKVELSNKLQEIYNQFIVMLPRAASSSLGQALSTAKASLKPTAVTRKNPRRELYHSISLRVAQRKPLDMSIFSVFEEKSKKAAEPDASVPEAFLLTRAFQAGPFRLAVEKMKQVQPAEDLDSSDFEIVNPALSPKGPRTPLNRTVSLYVPRVKPAEAESDAPQKDPEIARKEAESRQAAERAQREALKAQASLLAYAMQQRSMRMRG